MAYMSWATIPVTMPQRILSFLWVLDLDNRPSLLTVYDMLQKTKQERYVCVLSKAVMVWYWMSVFAVDNRNGRSNGR